MSSMINEQPKNVNETLEKPFKHLDTDILAILYAPNATKRKVGMLLEKLDYYLDRLDLSTPKIIVNPTIPIRNNDKEHWYKTLVVGWGLPKKPQWDEWILKYDLINIARQFLAFDLFERFGINGRVLNEPRVDAGKYWSRKVQEAHLKHFLKGYYVRNVMPYGMKRIAIETPGEKPSDLRAHYVLMPGKPDEVQIIRLIFDLFVNHDYNRTDICNLLNAQGVKPPGQKTIWRSNIVSAILKDPVYIGANHHLKTIRLDVFPSVLDKFMFFEAQAKIFQERIPREVPQLINYEVLTLK